MTDDPCGAMCIAHSGWQPFGRHCNHDACPATIGLGGCHLHLHCLPHGKPYAYRCTGPARTQAPQAQEEDDA